MSAGDQGGPSSDDRESLERDLESYRTYLLCVAWRLTSSRRRGDVGASDLVQRTIVAALVKVRGGTIPDRDESRRLAWLCRIMKNLWLNDLRSPEPDVVDSSIVGDATPPIWTPAWDELQRLLAMAFERLDPDERQLVAWRYVDGLTCEEIGRLRGYAASYASRVSRDALKRLRAEVKALGIGSASVI